LATFSGQAIRPTPDRVREALFSILCSRCGTLSGSRVLDLFAGTGALGIEALSRGAEHAWFVDSAPLAIRTIGSNLQRCNLSARGSIVSRDVWQALATLPASGPFQLIFADPPYGQGAGPRLLTEIVRLQLLAPGGLLVLETAVTDQVPVTIPGLQGLDQRRYGVTMIHLYQASAREVPP
jgi:16S rRNA (guanine(966)-N(2))-methyltransferase RsmD